MSQDAAGDPAAGGVILAENDALMRGMIGSMLTRAGHQVFPAANGVEAVMLARRHQAGLVLLDIAMPRLNGLRACEAIRALPGYERVPIVMLTGYADPRLRRSAQALGATGFITKPFAPADLLARLADHLDSAAGKKGKAGALPLSPNKCRRVQGAAWPPGGVEGQSPRLCLSYRRPCRAAGSWACCALSAERRRTCRTFPNRPSSRSPPRV